MGVALFGRKYNMLRIQLLFSMIALFVRIELLFRSNRGFPPKRANRVAVFESSPIRFNSALLYQIGLPSNTATSLALFGGSFRIKLL